MLDGNSLMSIDGTLCQTYADVDCHNKQFLAKNIASEVLNGSSGGYVLSYLNYAFNSLINGKINFKIWYTMFTNVKDIISKCSKELQEAIVHALSDADVEFEEQSEIEEFDKYRTELAGLLAGNLKPSER